MQCFKKSKIIKSPGLDDNHYKPSKPLRINARKPKRNEAWLAFGAIPVDIKGPSLSLSKKKNFKEAALNLYNMLRVLDKKNVDSIAVQKIPFKDVGVAINDRLFKASNKEKS